MTITKTKTWQYNVNNVVQVDISIDGTNAHFDRRKTLLGIKDALTGFGAGAWSVISSSDSTSAGASDLWTDEGDLVWRDDDTSNAFSWIVLRQTGISATFELLITCEEDFTGVDGARIGAWVAQAGFSGGTTTARPTATDEREIRNSTSSGWWGTGGDGSPNLTIRWHAMVSTDGECTRVVFYMGGVNTGIWLLDKPANPVSEWTNPYVAVILGGLNTATDQCTYTNFYDAANVLSQFNGVDTEIYLSGEGFGTNASGENFSGANQLSATFSASSIGLSSLSSTFVGRMGDVFDLWWGFLSNDIGTYYPGASSKSFVQVIHLIFPWDGSSILGTE